MILTFFSSLSLQFLAFAAGGALLVWALRNKGNGSVLASFIGTIITLLSFAFIGMTLAGGIAAWKSGRLTMDETSIKIEKLQHMEDVIHQLKEGLKPSVPASKH